MKCHDCGEPPLVNGLLAVVGGEVRAYCPTHHRIRWDFGCEKGSNWLRSGTGPAMYTGPLDES